MQTAIPATTSNRLTTSPIVAHPSLLFLHHIVLCQKKTNRTSLTLKNTDSLILYAKSPSSDLGQRVHQSSCQIYMDRSVLHFPP